MKKLSRTRQEALRVDIPLVHQLYQASCERFGREAVDHNLTLVWIMRCTWGVTGQLPFGGGMTATTLGELLYIARELCGYGSP